MLVEGEVGEVDSQIDESEGRGQVLKDSHLLFSDVLFEGIEQGLEELFDQGGREEHVAESSV